MANSNMESIDKDKGDTRVIAKKTSEHSGSRGMVAIDQRLGESSSTHSECRFVVGLALLSPFCWLQTYWLDLLPRAGHPFATCMRA